MRTRKLLAASAAAIVLGSTAGAAYAATTDADYARSFRITTGTVAPRADIATRTASPTTTIADCAAATYNASTSAALSSPITVGTNILSSTAEQWFCVKNIGRSALDVSFLSSSASYENGAPGSDEALSDATPGPDGPGELAGALTIEARTKTDVRERVARRVLGDGLLEEVETLPAGRAMLVRFRVIGPLHPDANPVSDAALEAAQTDSMQMSVRVDGVASAPGTISPPPGGGEIGEPPLPQA